MSVRERSLTSEAFWEIAQRERRSGRVLELSKGRVIETSPSGGEHGEIGAHLLILLGNFIRERGLGRLTTAETGYILAKSPEGDTVRAPDIGFISAKRAPEPLPRGFVPFAPDLVVEIMSPHDRAEDINDKINDYLQAGVGMIVIVSPSSKTVRVETPNDSKRLTIEEVWDGGDVLPGFRLPIRDIFALG